MSTSNDAGEHASPRMYFLQDEAASLAPGRQLPAPGAGSAVLLADDCSDMRELLKEILEDAGHRVQVASDGHEALERLRAGCFDVVRYNRDPSPVVVSLKKVEACPWHVRGR